MVSVQSRTGIGQAMSGVDHTFDRCLLLIKQHIQSESSLLGFLIPHVTWVDSVTISRLVRWFGGSVFGGFNIWRLEDSCRIRISTLKRILYAAAEIRWQGIIR